MNKMPIIFASALLAGMILFGLYESHTKALCAELTCRSGWACTCLSGQRVEVLADGTTICRCPGPAFELRVSVGSDAGGQ